MELVCINAFEGYFTVGKKYKVLYRHEFGLEVINDQNEEHTLSIKKDQFGYSYRTWFQPPYLKVTNK